jgi:hypothetical protein
VPKLGGGKEELRITQYERRFGDDRRNTRSRIFCPWFDFGRNIGGVCDVHRAEIKAIKERKHKMKKYKVIGERTEYYEIEISAESEDEAHLIADGIGLERWEELNGTSFRIDKESTEEV